MCVLQYACMCFSVYERVCVTKRDRGTDEDTCKSSHLRSPSQHFWPLMCLLHETPTNTFFAPLSIQSNQFVVEDSKKSDPSWIKTAQNMPMMKSDSVIEHACVCMFGGEGARSSSSPRHNKKLLTLPSMNMYSYIHRLPTPLPHRQRPRQSTSNAVTNCRGEPYRPPPGPPNLDN